VLREESLIRRCSVAAMHERLSTAQWHALGREYLKRTARFRQRKPISTDKLPANFQFTGAIVRMLPNARIIDARRDALETTWSCYKQKFADGLADFTMRMESLGAYWRDYRRLSAHFAKVEPTRFRIQRLADLLADPEREIRALLAFLGLEFESACLKPHEVARSVRTASAAQVREPMRARPGIAAQYGALLDPLRSALGEDA
jgi:hypothetical protein